MKFRMFTKKGSGEKVAICLDEVSLVRELNGIGTMITLKGLICDYENGKFTLANLADLSRCVYGRHILVEEDFQTVISRLNTIAE